MTTRIDLCALPTLGYPPWSVACPSARPFVRHSCSSSPLCLPSAAAANVLTPHFPSFFPSFPPFPHPFLPLPSTLTSLRRPFGWLPISSLVKQQEHHSRSRLVISIIEQRWKDVYKQHCRHTITVATFVRSLIPHRTSMLNVFFYFRRFKVGANFLNFLLLPHNIFLP